MEYKYTSIILSKRDVFEVDRIYFFYTLQEGKISTLGKGVRRSSSRLAGSLEPLTYAEIFVSKGRGLGNITGVTVINNFSRLKGSLEAMGQAFWALGYFEQLITQQEQDVGVFELLVEYLETLEDVPEEKIKVELVTIGFLFKLLERLGYRIVTRKCVDCGGNILAGNKNFFSAEKGGVVCACCGTRGTTCSDSAIKLMRIFLGNRVGNFSKLALSQKEVRELKAVLNELIRWVV